MGHKEDLLDGAKKCLMDKGFVRTTARDIVNASGANLASIGYHYGSKDALLMQAFLALMEEWGDSVMPSAGAAEGKGGSLERFRSLWESFLSTEEATRPLWRANLEVAMQDDRLPELRALLVSSQEEGRRGLVATFTGVPEEDVTEEDVVTLGAFYQALLGGVMIQRMFAPEAAVTAEQLTQGLRRAAELAAERG
ncbi:TetR/AcrR family transcriptional regulator [Streptomyces sp. NRRL S-87]|uniref:TetR/AcrR family transcriptional regulator n=1 Tax=Streptomyces sp. NRRL S-87 TaxID=1463920 RepID=UPI0004C2355B|nr:TetR/AcrR family transcriptional regulator [Streptomyces sp. NRRL S-87]